MPSLQRFRFLLALLAACWLADGASAQPNVILIMTDDQGYGDLACHGNKVLRTPNLDKLHARSVRLTNFHVDPTCSPTRSALMTGRYSSRTGVWHTIAGRSILHRDETTLADLFRAAGYTTGIFGKWHLGDNYPYRAVDRGWSKSLVLGGGGVGQTPDFWGNSYFDDTYWRNGRPEPQKGYCTDVFFSAALDFITRQKDRPFVCYIAPNAAHSPYRVADRYAQPYLDQGLPQGRARFCGMIANIDENIGRLIAHLRELKLDENTLIIFLTDNGTAAGWDEKGQSGFNAGMRGIKGSPYDGGHRVACFWSGPGVAKTGRDVSRLTAHIDILPTLLDLCAIKAKFRHPLDGKSLRGLLEDKGEWPERTLFVHSQRIDQPVKWRQSAVMTDRWRLVNGKELFDMVKDPGQRKDVAGGNPEVMKTLQAEYEKWWTSISTRFQQDCPIVLGGKENPTTLTAHDWRSETVPWDQTAVKKMPVANGWWSVEVEQAGKYRFTLRHQPAQAKLKLQAVKARLKIGSQEVSADVPADATEVTLSVTLQPGAARLQTWLEEKNGKTRGAFFTEVKRE